MIAAKIIFTIQTCYNLIKYVNSAQSDLLKSEVCEKSDAQKDGGYTTTKIWDQCQDLTVSFPDRVSGYILKYNKKYNDNNNLII